MHKFACAVLFLLALQPAEAQLAESFYVAQNGAGSATGTSCANARSLSWLNSSSSWGTAAGVIGAGDTVRFCGTITGSVTILGSGASGSPITFTAEPGSKFTRTHWTSTAIGSISNRTDLVLDGLTIEATASGTGRNIGAASAIGFARCDRCTIRNNIVRDTYVRTAGSGDPHLGAYQLYVEGGNDVSIHHNTLSNERYLINYGCPDTCARVEIYSNVLSKTAGAIILSAFNTNAALTGVKIYDNEVFDMSPWGGWWSGCPNGSDCWFHCDGMHIVAVQSGAQNAINNLEIFRNYLHGPTCITTNPFTGSTGTNMTAWIYVEGRREESGGGKIENALVHNNFILGDPGTNGSIYCRSCTSPKFFNNTLVGTTPGSGAAGIGSDTSKNVVAKNNLIGNRSGGIYGALSTTWGAVDYNAYFGLSEYNQFGIDGCCVLFSAWQAAGKDLHGRLGTAASLGINTTTWRLNAGSVLIDSATSVLGECPGCAVDKTGVPRPQGAGWDVGSFEFTADAMPPAPPENFGRSTP